MKVINSFLTEFYPSHPVDIVIKNEFYPKGLTELQVYNHYLSVKNKLLNWIKDRNVAFLIRVEKDQTVLIRNQKGKPIYLTNSNFENLITGRTNVIYVTHPELTNYWVVDIDIGPNLSIQHAKSTLHVLEHEFRKNSLETKSLEAIFSSPKGIHLIGYLNHQINIDLLRHSLVKELQLISERLNQKSKIQFTVNVKGRENNKINFDLSSMYPNSLHISKYSLTKEFLICDDVKNGLRRVG